MYWAPPPAHLWTRAEARPRNHGHRRARKARRLPPRHLNATRETLPRITASRAAQAGAGLGQRLGGRAEGYPEFRKTALARCLRTAMQASLVPPYGSQASGSFVAGAAPAKWGANCTARQVVRDRLPGLARLATVRYRSCRNAIRRSARRVPSPLIRALGARKTERYFEWAAASPGVPYGHGTGPRRLLAASATVTTARLCFYA